MKRNFIIFGLLLAVAINFGCTSNSEKQDEAVVEGDATTESGDSDFFAEESPEAATTDGEESTETTETTDTAENSDVTTDETGLEDFSEGGEEDLLADLGDDKTAPTPAPGADSGIVQSDPSSSGGSGSGSGELLPDETAGLDNSSNTGGTDPLLADGGAADVGDGGFKSWVPVKKIKDVPYDKAGMNVNAVYLAREGDTLKKVASKIFGTEDTSALKKINPTLSNKLKVGDKVYYSSPQRPDDKTRLLTYYEDIGLAPETYVSQAGDNIRTVAQTLLGHPESWKEVWATNLDVESKGELAEGTQLKYWRGAEGGALPPVAKNSPPPPAEGNDLDSPPPPADNMATAGTTAPPPPADNFPPPPSDTGAQNDDFPPPPSTATLEPPPPPPPPPPAPRVEAKSNDPFSMGDDPNQTMALAVGAILLLAALLLFIVIRKKRTRRDLDFNTSTTTQIE